MIPGTCFLPSEVEQLDEKTKAAYLMLNFGGPNAKSLDINVVGNVGVRVVGTGEDSAGSVGYPTPLNLGARSVRDASVRRQHRQSGLLSDARDHRIRQRGQLAKHLQRGAHQRVAELQCAFRIG